MNAPVTSIHMALPAGTDAAPPAYVHLLPAGTFSGEDGRGPYTVASAEAVIEASLAGGQLVLDENHATDHALRTGQAAPAQGWIDSMQAREDGIWGHVEWTPAGQALLAGRAYRGISPVFQHAAGTGAVSRILRAALTNAPNLPLTTLHSQEPDMDLLPALRQAMGLPDTADQAAVLAAVTAQHTAVASHAQQLAAIATAAGVPGVAAVDGIVTALQARGGGDALAQVVALQTQVTTMQTERARERATAAVDAAMRAGKPITPALREDFVARHMSDPEGAQRLMDGLPAINAGGFGDRAPSPPAGVAGATGADAAVIAMMGLDPVAYGKAKAAVETAMGVAS